MYKINKDDLIDVASKAISNAYAPYSNFPVGAAILMKDQKIFAGANVENASYGGTICAERNAITTAISCGYTVGDFEMIAIISNMEAVTPPCAICRQTLTEFFDEDSVVLMCSQDGNYVEKTVKELVPFGFGSKDLSNV